MKRSYVTHGLYGSAEYQIWKKAKARCSNPNNKDFDYYGGRGIEFRLKSVQDIIDEIGFRPKGLELDRINNNGHYEKGNIRWATRSQQRLNSRKRLHLVTDGKEDEIIEMYYEFGMSSREVAKVLGINFNTVLLFVKDG